MVLIRLADGLSKALMVLAAAWAFAICFFILADIVFRALNMPLQGTKEIVANSVVMIVFLQAGYAIRSGSMLRADFLVAALDPRAQRVVMVASLLLGAALFLFLMKAGIVPAMRSWSNGEFDGEGALRVPVWPARWMIVAGSALAALNYLILAWIEAFGLSDRRALQI